MRHGAKEYVIGGNSTNGIEGFWGHFKRMVFGTYHFVTKKYLQRYIDESVYRFNTKELKASDRFVDMFAAAIGKMEYLRQIYNNGVYSIDEFSAMMDEAIEKHCTD